jgi:hypothetical protein
MLQIETREKKESFAGDITQIRKKGCGFDRQWLLINPINYMQEARSTRVG